MPPLPFGAYLVHEQIGKGGMATIHVAEVAATGQRVALKRLHPRIATSTHLVAQFVREARLMKHLRHPHIAETFDFGQVGATHYLAMEYVRGPSLRELTELCAATIGAVPPRIALYLIEQLCDALAYAHELHDDNGRPLGLVHRDVSPANILISTAGQVKLIDFGLAKINVGRAETAQGVIKGKFGYVAPEYLGGALDARADLWAVGVVTYELLTGRRLFDAPDDLETMTRVKNLPIPRPSAIVESSWSTPRVPDALDAIVMRALERDPRRRWQTAAELRDALRAVISQPELRVEPRHVVEWLEWVYEQTPGGAASGITQLETISRPEAAPSVVTPSLAPVDETDLVVRPARGLWIVIAAVVSILAITGVIAAVA